MQRRDVALAIGLGLLLAGVAIAINDFGSQSPIGWAIEVAYRFWFVGAAAVVLAAVLDWRGLSRSTARVIGFAGLLWSRSWAGCRSCTRPGAHWPVLKARDIHQPAG